MASFNYEIANILLHYLEEGVDIKTKRITVEVEIEKIVQNAPSQLKGHRVPVYFADTDKKAGDLALEKTEGTTIRVMDSSGNVVKKSRESDASNS